MADVRIHELPAVSAAVLADLLPLRQGTTVTRKLSLTQLIAFILADASVIAAIAAATVTTEQIQDIAGAMMLDSATIDFTYDDPGATITAILKAASVTNTHVASTVITGQSSVTPASGDSFLISDVSDSGNLKKVLISDLPAASTQPLAQRLETAVPGVGTYTCLVRDGSGGLYALGAGGKIQTFDITTGVVTETTLTGATTVTYTFARYVGAGLIWATSGTKTHIIDIAAHTRTDITATTGVLLRFTYSVTQNKVYGFVSGSTSLKEMTPSTGAVTATYTGADTFGNGYAWIITDPNSNALLVQLLNDGAGGIRVCKIPLPGFSTNTPSATKAGAAITVQGNNAAPMVIPSKSWIAVCDPGNSQVYVWDYSSGTPTYVRQLGGRYLLGTQMAWNPDNSHGYSFGCANRNTVGKFDDSLSYLPTKAMLQMTTGNTNGAPSGVDMLMNDIVGGGDGYIYVLNTINTIIQIIP